MTPVLRKSPEQAAARFTASIRELSRLTGYDQRAVARAEIGAMLKLAAGKVKVANEGSLEFRARLRAEKAAFGVGTSASKNQYGITINTGRRGGVPGRVWFRTRNKRFQNIGGVSHGGDFEAENIHLRSGDWDKARAGVSQYITELPKAIASLNASVGLSRQSVVQMADALGISLENIPGAGASPDAIAKARRAMASNGQRYTNGSASDTLDGGKYLAKIMNTLPHNTRVKIDSAIASAMSQRAQRFQKAHEKGAFESVEKTVKQYPWMKLMGSKPSLPAAA